MQDERITPSQTPAEKVAVELGALITAGEYSLPNNVWSAPVDVMLTAAHHVARNWGEYGYSLALEDGSFGWSLFRGHHSDGSNFWFVVDRYCNVADLPEMPR
jgi:hypothetical protein